MVRIRATPASSSEIDGLRTRFRLESNCQIVHDSLHAREGWTITYLLYCASRVAGYGSIAVAGPWQDRPTIFEFYLLPEFRHRAFALFEKFLSASAARFFEVQSNHELLNVMLFRYGQNIRSEAIVMRDQFTTLVTLAAASLECQTTPEKIRSAIAQQRGGGKWSLKVNESEVGSGGILFHYNRPYADIYMEINESSRRCGYGTYLVQELKRICYELGGVPAARCNPANIASQRTLQKAGFVPYAHILDGELNS